MEFTVKLDRYEGPYTKLLDLIVEKKLSITEVSLASIADDYIAYVKSLAETHAVDVSQFVLVASTLMLMKAKSLLPGVVYTEEEEKQVHDLESKLEMFMILSRGCLLVQERYGKAQLYRRPRMNFRGGSVFVPDARISVTTLQSIALLTVASFKPPERLMKIAVEQVLRIETVIENLITRVQNIGGLTLSTLATGAETFEQKKKLLIVNFIALLELVRSGALSADQSESGGDIHIQAAPQQA